MIRAPFGSGKKYKRCCGGVTCRAHHLISYHTSYHQRWTSPQIPDRRRSPAQRDWEPEIFVDFSGPDATLLLDRGGELLRALELLAFEILHLPSADHERTSFDYKNQRSIRLQELRMAVTVAAEKVRQTGTPFHTASCTGPSAATTAALLASCPRVQAK